MKNSLILLLLILSAGCGTKVQTVTFEYQRTPLNPIAYHQGITNYQIAVESQYSAQYLQALQEHENEVARLTAEHEQLLNRYRQITNAERQLRQIPEPVLNLPAAPQLPHTPEHLDALGQKIKIAGMERSAENALFIRLTYQGFEVNNHRYTTTTKKGKGENATTDTLLVSEIQVRNPIHVFIQSPADQSVIHDGIERTTNSYSTIKGIATPDSLGTFNSMITNMNKEEIALYDKNIQRINDVLNSEFGTQYVAGRGVLHVQESNKNHDYSDLMQANTLAQQGLLQLKSNRNAAFNSMNSALGIWMEAMKSYNTSKRSRINPDVMKGILKNAILICIYTENWEFGQTYINQLRAMKLKSKDRAQLNSLQQQFNDLKKRYDALKK
jgi:hypothetical protein